MQTRRIYVSRIYFGFYREKCTITMCIIRVTSFQRTYNKRLTASRARILPYWCNTFIALPSLHNRGTGPRLCIASADALRLCKQTFLSPNKRVRFISFRPSYLRILLVPVFVFFSFLFSFCIKFTREIIRFSGIIWQKCQWGSYLVSWWIIN